VELSLKKDVQPAQHQVPVAKNPELLNIKGNTKCVTLFLLEHFRDALLTAIKLKS